MSSPATDDHGPDEGDRRFNLMARLQEIAWDKLCGYHWPLAVGKDTYGLPDDKTYASVFGDDVMPLLLRRESDGALFEVELDVFLRCVTPKEETGGKDQQQAVEGLPDVQEPQARQ